MRAFQTKKEAKRKLRRGRKLKKRRVIFREGKETRYLAESKRGKKEAKRYKNENVGKKIRVKWQMKSFK